MVTLLRPYAGFATGAVVTLPDSTEASLIAQGLATAGGTSSFPAITGSPDGYLTVGGNVVQAPQAGIGALATVPFVYDQGPRRLVAGGMALGSAALTGYETNGVAQTAGAWHYVEIFVPYWNTWTGIGVLNGTTVGTNKYVVALYGTNGALLANSAVAGTLTANASTMQNVAFTAPITLPPGRYIIGEQLDGTSDTVRHMLVANGAVPSCSTVAGTFGTVPSSITVPTTFTTAVAPISQLYT